MLATDGEEAIKIFKNNYKQIDLVLLDLRMPKKSGKETYIEMKKIYPSIKIILSSGFIQDEMAQELISLGIKNFIQKPYTFHELAKIVKQLII